MRRYGENLPLTVSLTVAAAVFAVLLILLAPPSSRPGLRLAPVPFSSLPGWKEADLRPFLLAFHRSCTRLAFRQNQESLGPYGGSVGDWKRVCAILPDLEKASAAAIRHYVETAFRAFSLQAGAQQAHFTGYYEPELKGSLNPGGPHRYPLWGRPRDLVEVDLSRFGIAGGRKIVGRIKGGRLVPYFTRAEIEAGALRGRAQPIAYVADPIAAFFLQIQGSGRVRLEDGSILRVGYAAGNGQPYRAIGRDLIAMGAITREDMSMQAIHDWLHRNPQKAVSVMNGNPSYVFFRRLDGEGPVGSQGVALTPRASIAVDRRWHGLGLPFWIDVDAGDDLAGGHDWRRGLMVAQDTGGAIRGPLRVDIFFGAGREARRIAGRLNARGRLWVLLPRLIVDN